MIFPTCLLPGDRIRIVSPAGKVQKDKILPGIELLQDEGYEVLVGNHVFDKHFQYSGTDKQRAADLQEAINDPDPVCFDFPVGHIPKNLALMFGSNYQLEVGENCRLIRKLS